MPDVPTANNGGAFLLIVLGVVAVMGYLLSAPRPEPAPSSWPRFARCECGHLNFHHLGYQGACDDLVAECDCEAFKPSPAYIAQTCECRHARSRHAGGESVCVEDRCVCDRFVLAGAPEADAA